MNPSEAWALLTIRSKAFAMSSKGHGATTTADVAALLAGLDRHPFLMGMAAECGDMNALRQIEWVLWVRAKTLADAEDWDPPHGEFTVRRMVGVALLEAIDDRRCPACNGQGIVAFTLGDNPALMFSSSFAPINGMTGRVQCSVCVGECHIRLSGRMKARLAGINKDTWTRIWARRYEPIFTLANGWREQAKQYLAARVREEEANVDTEAKIDTKQRADEAWKNINQINNSCANEKVAIHSPRRKAAPEANVTPPEVDFQALDRTVLRLTR